MSLEEAFKTDKTTNTPLGGEVDRFGGVNVNFNSLPAGIDTAQFSSMLKGIKGFFFSCRF
jgi:hypothetical protein